MIFPNYIKCTIHNYKTKYEIKYLKCTIFNSNHIYFTLLFVWASYDTFTYLCQIEFAEHNMKLENVEYFPLAEDKPQHIRTSWSIKLLFGDFDFEAGTFFKSAYISGATIL